MLDDFYGEELQVTKLDDSRPAVPDSELSDWESQWFGGN